MRQRLRLARPVLASFLRSDHGGATAIAAAAITLMTIMATGLTIDHLLLTDRRDDLKFAADAGGLAATASLADIPSSWTDAQVKTHVTAIATRYALINVPADLKDNDDLTITVEVDRAAGSVGVKLAAPSMATTFLRSAFGIGVDSAMTIASGAVASKAAAWMMLAVDNSFSMNRTIDGIHTFDDTVKRITIVRQAVADIVDILPPDPAIPIAIGVLEWSDSIGHIMYPSTDAATVDAAVAGISADGGGTMSSYGLRYSRLMLGGAPNGVRKVIVLLTDGEDNKYGPGYYETCSQSEARCLEPRRTECTNAKNAGIEIFTVTAMVPSQLSDLLGTELTNCASSPEHAFLNNTNADDLREAFKEIGGRVQALRRAY